MGETTYDAIGESYNRNRTADPRILKILVELLGPPSRKPVVDIGAGTGNYTNALAQSGYTLSAIEPSATMRRQAVPHGGVTWIKGNAEDLPLRDGSMGGAVIVLAVHHFSDTRAAAGEVARVCPEGPLVIFTMDPRQSEEFWFNGYFPEIAQQVFRVFPPLDEVISTFSGAGHWSAQVTSFPLPCDLTDRNMCSGWNRPEIYLDPHMRQNTSGFALASPSVVRRGLELLTDDLRSGNWDRLHGHLRSRESFDAGFRFIVFGQQAGSG